MCVYMYMYVYIYIETNEKSVPVCNICNKLVLLLLLWLLLLLLLLFEIQIFFSTVNIFSFILEDISASRSGNSQLW